MNLMEQIKRSFLRRDRLPKHIQETDEERWLADEERVQLKELKDRINRIGDRLQEVIEGRAK
jgi:hypothetical protein